MWGLNNRTVYEAERGWILDKDARKHWVVVVKGTFDIKPDGSTVVSAEPLAPFQAPEYNGEEGVSSIKYEGDITAEKTSTDVIVNGTAHAPGGKPTRQMTVAVRIGDRQKIVAVEGDRVYERDVSGQVIPSSPKPFVEMPLQYERAWGGFDQTEDDPSKQKMDFRNPVGCGVAARGGHLVGKPVANLSYPGKDLDKAGPAGFGAIACHWSPRREYAGTYDAKWIETRKPLLPTDFDPRYYQYAPVDQQFTPNLRGGEPVEIVNMTKQGVLKFALPKVYLAYTTKFGFRKQEHRGKLAAVIIEPDFPRVVMLWHTVLPCHHLVDELDETHIKEKPYI